jgi:hypothetical protein
LRGNIEAVEDSGYSGLRVFLLKTDQVLRHHLGREEDEEEDPQGGDSG